MAANVGGSLAETTSHVRREPVLLVPPQLAKSSYAVLIRCHCVARLWHLAGRHGSRTHRYGDFIAIPILSEEVVSKASLLDRELCSLLRTQGVSIVEKDFQPSNRIHIPPPFDARIHPERAPPARVGTGAEITQVPSRRAAFSYAELFAGIGGFGVALESLGGECVFCSEIDEVCRTVYALNFSTKNQHGDIYEVRDRDFPSQLDLLVGGFPCQPFSSLGEQPGLHCPKGNLFLQIVRVLKLSKPKAFLLENVPGLVRMKDSLNVIANALSDAGYDVTTEVCDARGLVATSRKRLFFVGLRRQQGIENAPFEFPFIPDLGFRGVDVLEYCDITNDTILRINDDQMDRLSREKYWKPAHLAWPNTVCQTLVSHYGNSVSRGKSQLVPCATGNPRRFSARECARIMGFPDRFILPKQRENQGEMAHLKEQYRMFGNAVCPPLIAAIAGAVLARCNKMTGYSDHSCWVDRGRFVAVKLANEATLRQDGITEESSEADRL